MIAALLLGISLFCINYLRNKNNILEKENKELQNGINNERKLWASYVTKAVEQCCKEINLVKVRHERLHNLDADRYTIAFEVMRNIKGE